MMTSATGRQMREGADIQVREAVKEDIPQLLRLYRQLQPLDDAIDEGSAADVWERAAKDDAAWLVAEAGGRIAGTVFIAIIPNMTRGCSPIGFIENIIVDEECRRQGIGRVLADAAIEYAKSRGCYKVTLQSGIKRQDAHKFYRAVGFDGDSKLAFEARL